MTYLSPLAYLLGIEGVALLRGIREGGIVMGVNPRSRQDADYFEREWTRCGGEQIYCPPRQGQDAAA